MAKSSCTDVLRKAAILASIATSVISSAMSAEMAKVDDIANTDDVISIGDISEQTDPAESDSAAKEAKKAKKVKKAKKAKTPQSAKPAEPVQNEEPVKPADSDKTQDETPDSEKTEAPIETTDSPSDKKLKYGYEGIFDAIIAGHLHEPRDLASQKLNFLFEENASYGSDWKSALGFSAWNESSFATVPDRYSGSVIRDDSRDLRLRNAYVQYRSDNFFLRVGNQQVVWGEAFGFFYSDIVNPKDLRYGLFGDFSQIRLQTPMVNAKLTFADLSLQAIFIPKPYFNILPSPGNDFAFPYQSITGIPTSINRETTIPISASSMEAGARASYLLDRLDLSAFFFNYIDRDPWYTISADSQLPSNLVLQEHHSRVQSFGLTATDDIGGFIFRVEALTTRNRTLPVVVNSGLGTAKLDDYIYVIGMDVPPIEKWNLGFQWSQDILSQDAPGLLRDQVVSLASLRLQYPLFKNQSAELLYTYSVRDAGQRAEFNYLIPLSGRVETTLGVDVLGGPPTSAFGSIYQATRTYILFKYFLKVRG